MAQRYDAEQKQGYCQRQQQRYARLSRFSLDPDNQRMYGARAKAWGLREGQYRKFVHSLAGQENISPEVVANAGGSGIIEKERMRRSMEFAVPKGLLTSHTFRQKFDAMDSDPKVQREYYQRVKEMLMHRSGNNGEDLMFYNTRTGKWYISKFGTKAGTPEYNAAIRNGLKESRTGEIVSFHNHPTGMPPSDSDLNAALQNGYLKGYTIGHNGVIFEYTPPKQKIPKASYLAYIEKYKRQGFSEYGSQLFALKDLSRLYDFEVREVI